ncbi:MAG: GAF and ANTAR domain-containing protein [Actinoallomurus sp.]
MREDRGSDVAETRLNRLLNLILETAVEALGFDAATVTARYCQALATIGATDQRLVELDDAQYDSGAGPCLSVLEPHDPIYLEDAGQGGDGWERFTRTAVHLGVRSTLSVHIPTDTGDVAASLNFYAKRRLVLADSQVDTAESFAQQLAAVIQGVDAYRSSAKLAYDLAEAMRSRAVIEQAKGVLMADHHIDADQAFERLVQLSQRSNVKLRDVARRLVDECMKPPTREASGLGA